MGIAIAIVRIVSIGISIGIGCWGTCVVIGGSIRARGTIGIVIRVRIGLGITLRIDI